MNVNKCKLNYIIFTVFEIESDSILLAIFSEVMKKTKNFIKINYTEIQMDHITLASTQNDCDSTRRKEIDVSFAMVISEKTGKNVTSLLIIIHINQYFLSFTIAMDLTLHYDYIQVLKNEKLAIQNFAIFVAI